MTGVIEGSGGTGVLEGHRPGTGVEGGGDTLVPTSIGNFADTTGTYATSWETPSMTVPIGEAMFLVFVQSTCGVDQPAEVYTCEGLGLEWERLVYNYYDLSTSGSDRSSQALFVARGDATDGTLTFTKDLYTKLAVSVIEVENGQIATSGWAFASAASTDDLTVPALPDPLPATVLIAGNQRFDDSQREPVLEADWEELGWTGWATFNAAVKTAYVSNDVDTTFDIATDAGNQGGIVIGVTSLAPTYLAVMNDKIGPNARYEGFPITPAAAPQPYVDELADMASPPNARYPGFPIGTGVPLATYNDVVAADDPSTLVYPGPKGTTADPVPAYDPTAEGIAASTYIEPGPKGTTPDPVGAYDTELAGFSLVRRYPMNEIDAAAPLASYDQNIVTNTTPVRWMPLRQLNTLEGEILALAPVSYWRLNENTAGAVTDQGSLANDASTVGGVTWADAAGPDGQLYPTFDGTTGYLSAPDQNEYSIDTVAGSTFLITFKPTAWTGTPLLLGKFVVSDNEWFVKFSSTDDGQGLVAQVYNTGQAFPFLSAEIDGPSASLDAWHTLIVTFPPGDTIPKLFFNSDTAQTTTDVGPSGTREPDSTGPLTIGGSTSSAGFFTGAIGHVAVWDTELAGAAITDLINAAVATGWTVPELPRTLRNFGPAGYWKLDDSDDTVADSSGNARNGTANFSTSPAELEGPDGRHYRTFDADPAGDYRGLVEIAHNTDYDPDGHGLTVVALIYTDVADLMYPIVKRPSVNQFSESGWQIDHSSSDWRSSILDTGGSTFRESTDAASVTTGEWQLVVVRQGDQAAANNEIELFVDSDTVTSVQTTGNAGTYASNLNAPLFFGGHPWTPFYGLNGAMAHVAVYPRELTDLEVQAIYDAAIADGWIEPPPSYVGASSAVFWASSSTLQTVTAPARDPGDLLLLDVMCEPTQADILAPAGWDLIRTDTIGNIENRLYQRTADGTATDSAAITPSGVASGGAAMVVYRNAVVVQTAITTAVSPASGVTVGPSLTATTEGQIGVSIALRNNGSGAVWLAADKGTERLNVSGNWMCQQVVDVTGDAGDEIGLVGHNFVGGATRLIVGVELT